MTYFERLDPTEDLMAHTNPMCIKIETDLTFSKQGSESGLIAIPLTRPLFLLPLLLPLPISDRLYFPTGEEGCTLVIDNVRKSLAITHNGKICGDRFD